MTDEERGRVEALANWAAEDGDPDILILATAALDGDDGVLEDVLAIHAVWKESHGD